jgi:hypothetical protein
MVKDSIVASIWCSQTSKSAFCTCAIGSEEKSARRPAINKPMATIRVSVTSYCYESPKPAEFGGVGLNWEAIGWRVRVTFTSLRNRIRPKDHIGILRSLLPERYSPLQESGNGLQSIYLTLIPNPLAETLIGLIGEEATHKREDQVAR